jgi:hypothetical protein
MTDPTTADSRPVSVDEKQLRNKGFTNSGVTQFCESVRDYCRQLLDRAVHLGDADKAPDMEREITHDHVRGSAHSIARSFGTPPRSKWLITAHVTEYLATAVAGIGAGHLDKPTGIISFGVGVSVAVILVVVRLTHGKGE